jgi:steroid delta-isomerase-like uncharacterized protein
MTTSHAALIAEFFEDVWNTGDTSACDRYLADRYTIHHDPGDPWHGQTLTRDGFKERLRVSRAPFPDQRFVIDATFPSSDAIAVTWHWTGTHLGDLPGLPATGKQITMTGATVYYIENERITGHWQVVDRLGVYQQIAGPR